MIIDALLIMLVMALTMWLALTSDHPIDLSKDWEEKYRAEFMKEIHAPRPDKHP